jgi:hypothetical protein
MNRPHFVSIAPLLPLNLPGLSLFRHHHDSLVRALLGGLVIGGSYGALLCTWNLPYSISSPKLALTTGMAHPPCALALNAQRRQRLHCTMVDVRGGAILPVIVRKI